jgi:mono/diheme cytochrome c family protein
MNVLNPSSVGREPLLQGEAPTLDFTLRPAPTLPRKADKTLGCTALGLRQLVVPALRSPGAFPLPRAARRYLLGLTAVASLTIGAGAAFGQQIDVSAGRALFLQRCAVCHGEKADGHSRLAEMLNPRPANLLASTLDVAARNQIVRKGGAFVGRSPVMPRWELELSEAELATVIAYVGSIAPPHPALATPDKP